MLLTSLLELLYRATGSGFILALMDFRERLLALLPLPALLTIIFTPLIAAGGYCTYTLSPVFALKSHDSRVQEEAVWGIFAGTLYAFAGIPPLKILHVLGEKDCILPALSKEIARMIRDSRIRMVPLLEVLREEYKRAKGFWRSLLGSIITLETTGGDIVTYFRDLYRTCIRDLRVHFENQAKTMSSISSAVTVFLAILPMSVYVMLVIVASSMVLQSVIMFTIMNVVMGLTVALVSDMFVPKVGDLYLPVYRKIIVKYLPVGVCVGLASWFGLICVPLMLKFQGVISLALGTLAFCLPAYLEFRRHARAIDETIENLPTFIRDVADEVKRGASPLQALAHIHETRSYGRYFDRLLRLLINKINLQGVRKALEDLKPYLPRQVFFCLDVIADADEIGARAEVFDVLADIMHDWVNSIHEFQASVRIGKYTSLMAMLCAIGITIFLFGHIVKMIASAGDMIRQMSSSPYGSMPVTIDIATSDLIPALKNYIFLALGITSIILGLVGGKVASFRFGDGFKDTAIMVILIVASLIVGSLLGLL